MFLLDTNVLSALRRPERAERSLLRFAEDSISEGAFISAVSVMEIEHGALLLARRDQRQGAMLMEWLEAKLLPEYSKRVLDVTLAVARRCAALHVPNPQAYRDAFIAATALGAWIDARHPQHKRFHFDRGETPQSLGTLSAALSPQLAQKPCQIIRRMVHMRAVLPAALPGIDKLAVKLSRQDQHCGHADGFRLDQIAGKVLEHRRL